MRLRFILSQIGKGLRSHVAMTISVILVTFISLTFVGVAYLIQSQVGKLKGEWYDKVEVAVFMCAEGDTSANCAHKAATEEQIKEVGQMLESTNLKPFVQDVFFETKEQAYENAKKVLDSSWVEQLTPEQMPVSYRIKLTDPTQYEVISDELTGRPGVESVVDQREVLDPLFKLLDRATLTSIGLGAVMIVAAALLITTTIRLSAMSRRRETEIMRYVGASTLFIQLPFMIEGAIAALIGAALAVAGLWAGVRFLVEGWLAQGSSAMNTISTTDVWFAAPWLILLALVLALVSSMISLSRYTKV
ncbi:cell division transport system permease protein [Bowdeniella nasicola]|uniref:Cell division protein FtsX n=1 Tax=Bowdeniella nasicola TaxID=208480 RepID=A0A1H3Z3Z6_9ACTO|nr:MULTISPECIES: permease-like cell division protein FtsX [Bowdeniella]SEA18350.1 cell division transport system permease protein [Bowdeniella nasicola]